MTKEEDFFHNPCNIQQKRYEALRLFYYDKKSASYVAKKFGYTISSFYSIAKDFKKSLNNESIYKKYFAAISYGRTPKINSNQITKQIVGLRKKYLPINEIKVILDSRNINTSESHIYNVLKKEGFARLPRRDKKAKTQTISTLKVEAPKTELLEFKPKLSTLTPVGYSVFSHTYENTELIK